MLRSLGARYHLGIVTTRPRDQADAFLRRMGVIDLFRVKMTQESTRHLKPHPEPILKAARVLGVQPRQCVMVGDTRPDIRAARRAGAQSVGVLCGIGSFKELSEADLILANTSDLVGFL
jgi:HAD superfamily hydrolase (TIGR01549 family)